MKNNCISVLLTFVFLLLQGFNQNLLFAQNDKTISIEKGVIEGAYYKIAVPETWNGHLLLIAHGYIPAVNPLVVDLDTSKIHCQNLLSEGWIIAATSYRRNGMIVKEGIEDIENLRKHIIEKHGIPKKTIVEGFSMGATIATLIAETRPESYDGALAIGLSSKVKDPKYNLKYTYTPKIPLIFMSNSSELGGIKWYLGNRFLKRSKNAPAFWTINRNGHVNVNSQEEENAIKALVQKIEGGKITLEKDATVYVEQMPSTAEKHKKGIAAKITKIDSQYGNVEIGIHADDLKALDLKQGYYFSIKVGGRVKNVYWGNTYKDVSKGYWVAFVKANGYIELAQNYENAAKSLNCTEGEQVFIWKQERF